MAYVFKRGKMASGVLDVDLANAVSQVNVKDGSLVVLGNLAQDTTYSASGVEYDTYVAAAPTATSDEVVIVDLADISKGDIAGNTYKMGIKLYDLEAKAGDLMRVRRLHLHDKFWLGASNFATAPVVGQYATATANAMTHTPSANKPASGYGIKILVQEDLTAGMASKGSIYLCEVISL